MTAWHVIKAIKVRKPKLEVKFLDERIIPAFVPPQFASECSQRELEQLFPKDDAEVNGLHDVALLTLKPTVGASRLRRFIRARRSSHGARVELIDHPEGKYRGIGIGMFRKLRGLSNRWLTWCNRPAAPPAEAASIRASSWPASIRGGCRKRRVAAAGALVSGLPQEVHDLIARDEAPPTIWSLDGTVNGAGGWPAGFLPRFPCRQPTGFAGARPPHQAGRCGRGRNRNSLHLPHARATGRAASTRVWCGSSRPCFPTLPTKSSGGHRRRA